MGQIIAIGGEETEEKANHYYSPILSEILKNKRIESTLIISPSSFEKEETMKLTEIFYKILKKKPDFIFLEEYIQKNLKKCFDKIQNAQLIYFTGGQQKKFMQAFGNPFIHLLQEQQQKKDTIIAGTSAGAMIFSEKTLLEGSGEDSQINETIELGQGLNLLPHLIIDTHFLKRGRFARLAHAIKKYPDFLGLGLESNTAVVFESNLNAKLYGFGTITIIDGSHIKTYTKKPENESVTHLEVHLLAAGCTYNFKKRQMIIKPKKSS